MYWMGQTVLSVQLAKGFKLESIRSVALCTRDRLDPRPLLTRYKNIEFEEILKKILDKRFLK